MGGSVRVASVEELVEGVPHRVELDGRAVSLVRLGESVYAIGDRCSHAEVSLSEGEVDPLECTIECPEHGSLFDLRTGEPESLPAVRPVPTYQASVRDGEVFLDAESPEGDGG